VNVEFELDGDPVSADVDPTEPLRDVLRREFDCTGVKSGCLSGRCGVCTVHVDGDAAKSCLVLAGKVQGRSVTTIEGLTDGDGLHDVQRALDEHFGLQCGYCTPGFVMSAVDYLEDDPDPDPDRDEIKAAIKGNVCRCTGYVKILDAIEDVAAERAAADDD
jgi:aerobic-type carbon monoxide dehydrogenase small subunit (CoxS/CutS family)